MFKFKGISSNDMQVVIEEEEHFIARAARRYEVTEIEGRDGAIFNELGYSYVERPIYVQCLNTNKIDDILAWLDGEGEFEYKGRKTTARFYSQLEPQRETVIRIIDTTFIRDPFWTKLEDEFVEVKGDKEKNAEAENINIKGTIPVKFKEFKVSGNSKQDTREGKNLTNYKDWTIIGSVEEITKQEDDEIICEIKSSASYGIKDIERTLKPNTAYTACVDYEFSQPLTSAYGLRVSYNGNYTAFNREGIVTFTTDETGLARMQFYVGMPYSGEAGILTVKNIRLYEGTYTKETIPEYEEYGAMPSPEYPSEIQNVEGNVNVTVANKEKTEQQTVTFPLAQGQKLYKGDYLADDGIHHARKQIELDGTENWELYSDKAARILRSDVKGVSDTSHIGSILSNFFKTETQADLQMGVADNGIAVRTKGYKGIVIRIAEFTTLQEYKDWLSSKKSAGTPVVTEYELAEEEIEPYTEEQQEAYNQIKELTAYEEETNIYSTNEVSPIFKVTYIEETTEKIENEGNIYSRPILRLKKTSYNNVDLEIAGTRFQYNFNDESYIEIDCEEKTALYEGFNRNRQLTIGYEFPKLAPGENDIKMYEGDCIIEVKRKDRWL